MGVAAIVAGGIAAAVAGPAKWTTGSWVAAYLVLAMGIGQIGLGCGQAVLAAAAPAPGVRRTELLAWNIGSVAVIGGTLAVWPVLVTLGGALMVVTLVMCANAIRGTQTRYVWTARGYVGLILILVLSIPIGIVLSWLGD